MGKGRRRGAGVAAAARQEREEEEERRRRGGVGGGQGRGRGSAVPSSSNAKKMRSLEEILGVGELELPSKGGRGELVADQPLPGVSFSELSRSYSSSSSLCGLDSNELKRVEVRGLDAVMVEGAVEELVAEQEEGEDEAEADGGYCSRDGEGRRWTSTKQGSDRLQVVEVLYTPVRGGAVAAVRGRGGGRGGGPEPRRAGRKCVVARVAADAQQVFDGMPTRGSLVVATPGLVQGEGRGVRQLVSEPLVQVEVAVSEQLRGGGYGEGARAGEVRGGELGAGMVHMSVDGGSARHVLDEMPQRSSGESLGAEGDIEGSCARTSPSTSWMEVVRGGGHRCREMDTPVHGTEVGKECGGH